MYLAFQEIRHAPARFIAISAVVFLVSYLVYFLTGLAWGLASSYTESVEAWKARSMTMTEGANENILVSHMVLDQLDYNKETTAPLSVAAAAVGYGPASEEHGKSNELVNVFIFGVEPGSFLDPKVSEGDALASNGHAVADSTLKRDGYRVGDTVELPQTGEKITIAGFADQQRFQAAPVVFVPLDEFGKLTGMNALVAAAGGRQAASGASGQPIPAPKGREGGAAPPSSQAPQMVSALVSTEAHDGKDLPTYEGDADIATSTIDSFIEELPGYRAQYLTFALMIGALIGILSLVLGIFMYVLTLQKKHIFGIMKAQGIPTGYIARAGAFQTLMITSVGMALGLAAAVISGIALSAQVPFKAQPLLFAAVTAAFVVFTLVGSLFPIRIIAKIDPIKAIG